MSKGIVFLSVSEFGWEYLRWSGYCRKLASQNERSGPYFVCTHEGREILYKDFCDGSIAHDFWFMLKRDAGVDYGKFHGYGLTAFKDLDFDELGRWAQRVIYQKYGVSCDIVRHPIGIKRKYEYKKQYMRHIHPDRESAEIWENLRETYLKGIYKIAAVFPRKKGDIRDWGEENYAELMTMIVNDGYGVVIGGDPTMSFCAAVCTKHSQNLINLTRLPRSKLLSVLIAALQDCTVAVGSQSILPIIAMGQGVPTLMWGCEPKRHSQYYNWSGTRVKFIESQDYSVSPKQVFEKFGGCLTGGSRSSVSSEVEWQMLKTGEKLPDEKDKELARGYSDGL